jgi:hypothetical protein
MNRVTVLVGITVLAVLAGCAKKEAPQVQDEDEARTATQSVPAAPKPEPKIDLSKAASEMVALIDPSPQCQQYRDELQAKGTGVGPVDELSEILVQAYKAGCGKKKQQ